MPRNRTCDLYKYIYIQFHKAVAKPIKILCKIIMTIDNHWVRALDLMKRVNWYCLLILKILKVKRATLHLTANLQIWLRVKLAPCLNRWKGLPCWLGNVLSQGHCVVKWSVPFHVIYTFAYFKTMMLCISCWVNRLTREKYCPKSDQT